MKDVTQLDIESCPGCGRKPARWYEKPQFGSRAMWWFACQIDGLLVGGIGIGAALQNWNRLAHFRKYQPLRNGLAA